MSKIAISFKSLDAFGETIGFSVKKGQKSFKTVRGAVLSLIIYSLIVIYGITKFQVMLNREDTKFQETVNKFGPGAG